MEVKGSTPTGGTCPNDFSNTIEQDIRTQGALSSKYWYQTGGRITRTGLQQQRRENVIGSNHWVVLISSGLNRDILLYSG